MIMLRVATFNIENLDDKSDDKNPPLEVRVPILRGALRRLNADILCLQEVHGQELPEHTSNNPKRSLSALDTVLQGTEYEMFHRVHTMTAGGEAYNERNLVILSRYPISASEQYRNTRIDELLYRRVTAIPKEPEAKKVGWERPILHAEIQHPQLGTIHVLNLHLKSRIGTPVPGQKDGFSWNSAAGWAEGSFLSAIKRVGQALETRVVIDDLLESNPDAKIIVCGDFNGEPGEVPVEAICGKVENTDNPNLRANVLIPCSLSIPDSVRFSHYHHGQGNLLDHMVISQSLVPFFMRAMIYNENLHDESLPFRFDTKYPESDHAPFVSEFAEA
ncbi:MAG: endonuclease [Nitrospirales bacterium]|nr:MAG: endonuclease [Nitrospirales bacterium]